MIAIFGPREVSGPCTIRAMGLECCPSSLHTRIDVWWGPNEILGDDMSMILKDSATKREKWLVRSRVGNVYNRSQ